MSFALAPEALAAGYRLQTYETIGSTSVDATARARAGERGPLWVVAAEQSAGTGRRGSAWASPRGNLSASLLLTTDLPPAQLATLGFVAGLSLDRALAAVCGADIAIRSALDDARWGRERFALKWPNDVMADGGKLAGILLGSEELGGSEELSAGRRALVIGIGVNVAHAPEGLSYPAASLHALGCDVDASDLFAALSAAWVEAYAIWCRPAGFEEIRRSWLARAAGLGGAVAVKSAEGVTRGVFETIDEHGQLVVRIADGSARKVSAGEVHFGVAASATPELRA